MMHRDPPGDRSWGSGAFPEPFLDDASCARKMSPFSIAPTIARTMALVLIVAS